MKGGKKEVGVPINGSGEKVIRRSGRGVMAFCLFLGKEWDFNVFELDAVFGWSVIAFLLFSNLHASNAIRPNFLGR